MVLVAGYKPSRWNNTVVDLRVLYRLIFNNFVYKKHILDNTCSYICILDQLILVLTDFVFSDTITYL